MITKEMLNIKEVVFRTGLSMSTIYRQVKSGDFPPPLFIGERRKRWTEQSINDWIDFKVKQRDICNIYEINRKAFLKSYNLIKYDPFIPNEKDE